MLSNGRPTGGLAGTAGEANGAAAAPALVLQLEGAVAHSIRMDKPLDPATWSVLGTVDGPRLTLQQAMREFPDLPTVLAEVLVSVEQDADGQHLFIRFADALAGRPLELVPEVEAKAGGSPLLYARPAPAAGGPASAPAAICSVDFSALVRDDLAPHEGFTNYSVVPWLCLGRTQRVLLVDERTLTADHPSERILDHVSLVVNCHEDVCDRRKYKVGKAISGGPDVLCEAVHKWYCLNGNESTVARNHAIQRSIWQHLEQGNSVAVHCLAGIHRAACIVACHFMFRHYVLGHQHVPHLADDIYAKLKSVRPHVSPAYQHVLVAYEDYARQLAAGR